MSIKKYLSLEEAAGILKLKPDELVRLREKGEVRGFADRGTWKFKAEDIEELKRRRQPDSNPEVPMMDDDDEISRQPTIITKGRGAASDSDVRLVPDDRFPAKLAGSSADIPAMADSDSDVRLTEVRQRPTPTDSDVQLVAPKMLDSDSDVKLTDSDSDVQLADSDSDVRLAPPLGSDSDVKLVGRGQKKKSSDSDVSLLPTLGPKSGKSSGKSFLDFDDASLTGADSVLLDDTNLPLGSESGIRLGAGSAIRLSGDSGIALTAPADSGILLEGDGGSGFVLQSDSAATLSEDNDSDLAFDEGSGITLEGDSGIHLSGDSGIRLDADSGIRLSGGNSGKRLAAGPRSGVKRGKPQDDLDSGIPLLLSKDDAARTDVEVPMLDDSSELATLNLPPAKKKGKGDTSIVMFEEDEEAVLGGISDLDDDESYALDDSGTDDDELEVADDILGEDDELEQLEVFDSDDSVFDESFVEGGSAADLPALGSRIAVPQEVEWGTGTLSLLAVSTLALTLGAMISVDLLRTIWGNAGSSVYSGELIGIFSGLFK